MGLFRLLLLEFPPFLLLAGKGKWSFAVSALIFAVLIIGAEFIRQKKHIRKDRSLEYPLLSCLVCLLFAAVFIVRWGSSQRLEPLVRMLDLPSKQVCFLAAFLLAFLSLPGVDHLIHLICDVFHFQFPLKMEDQKAAFAVVLIGLTAFLIMLLNSRSSPLYPINDWVDPNTMFTVGKGVLKGYVPYRDLYEQKGPLLLFIHTFGAFLSYDSFTGVWIAELVCCFATLLLVYKITSLFFGSETLIVVPLFAALIYGTQVFSPGDSAEEYCIPLLALAFYAGVRAVHENRPASKREFLLTGAAAGGVFWIKYSIVGLFAGWVLFFLVLAIRERKLRTFFRGLLCLGAGFFLVSVPILVYFMVHSAAGSLFEVYFYNNIFLYSNRQVSLFDRLWIGFGYFLRTARVQSLFIFAGLLWIVIRKKGKLFLYVLMTFSLSVFFIYLGGVIHGYSGIPLGMFSVLGFLCLCDMCCRILFISARLRRREQIFSVITLFAALVLVCLNSHNMRYLNYGKDDWFQYQMKAVIDRSGKKDPTILYYHMGDGGVNTVSGLIPNLRFFCYYHNPNLAEMEQEQTSCINSQCADYIIAYAQNDIYYPEFETYEHAGYFVGIPEEGYPFYHYYVPVKSENISF